MPLKFLYFSATSTRPVEKTIELKNKLGAPVPNSGVYSIMLRTEVSKVLTQWKDWEIGLRCDQNALETFPYLVLYVTEQQAPGKNSYPTNQLFYDYAKSFNEYGPHKVLYRGDVALFKVTHSDRAIIFNLCNCTLEADYDIEEEPYYDNENEEDHLQEEDFDNSANEGSSSSTSGVKTVIASTLNNNNGSGASVISSTSTAYTNGNSIKHIAASGEQKKKKNKKNNSKTSPKKVTERAQIIEELEDSISVKSRSSSISEDHSGSHGSSPISLDLSDSDGEIDEVDLLTINDNADLINVTNWKQKIAELKDKAEDEGWTTSSSSSPEVILFHYIHSLFLYVMKSLEENRDNNSFALMRTETKTRIVFNTGLKESGYLVSSGEYLYAILERVDNGVNGVQWCLLDFAPWLSCMLRYQFESKKPDVVKLFSDRELQYDLTKELQLNWNHLIHSKSRLPSFLSNEWRMKVFFEGYLKHYLYPQMNHNPQLAVPSVYKRTNQTLGLEFLLPLCFTDPHRVDLVLAVRPTKNAYIGHTVLFVDWAYTLARSLSPIPAHSWIKTGML